ncbi:MAG TPA: YqiJ family protein [Povalibacter sp.]|uniref:YqiJ family protein n=1 Tax=Povalibacter sp. TaxID=1962978 RepID=UPI002C2E729E|nr:YqiJ family protein [Povalibacter sp.]HMN44331.1 YqiJ family protein [Povalibacter sp.]
MLFAAETWPFTVATFLMLLIAIVEGIAMVIGANLSEWLQNALPDPWDHIDGPFDRVLGWLHVGRVPLLVLLVLFLAGFAVTGFALNMVVHRIIGLWIPPLISVPLALFATLPVVRILGAGLARLIPTDQTYAVSFESLIGRVATIVAGTARHGYPAQARVQNEHGQNLYVMVEPEAEDATFGNGERILLKRRISGSRFAGVANPWPDLI